MSGNLTVVAATHQQMLADMADHTVEL
jgi:ABC-type lipoprotein export system ATPase subunit